MMRVVLLLAVGAARFAGAQDVSANLRIRVLHDSLPVARAIVRSGRVAGQTASNGEVTLRLSPGAHAVIVTRLGFVPDTIAVTLAANQDTTVVSELEAQAAEM